MLEVSVEQSAGSLLRELKRRGLVVKLDTFDRRHNGQHWHLGFDKKPGVLEVTRELVDAMVDTERAALRPLLERALHDTDAWIRWKALRGLVGLGVEPSRDAVIPLAADVDFRVRLEAAGALRRVSDA